MKVEHIRLEPADNGLILAWSYVKETKKNSCSRWEDHKKVYSWEQEDEAMEKLKELHMMNIKYYKMEMAKAKKKSDTKPKSQKEGNPGVMPPAY